MLHFDLLTLFPDFFGSFLSESLIGKSIEKELLQVELNNFREFGIGSHRKVDDDSAGKSLRPEESKGMESMRRGIIDGLRAL